MILLGKTRMERVRGRLSYFFLPLSDCFRVLRYNAPRRYTWNGRRQKGRYWAPIYSLKKKWSESARHKTSSEEEEELEHFSRPSIDAKNKKRRPTLENRAPFTRKEHSLIKSSHRHYTHATKDGTDGSTRMMSILSQDITIPYVRIVLYLRANSSLI